MRPLAVALLALLALPAAAPAQERVTAPTPVAAHGGTVAWSVREGDAFALVARAGDGPVQRLPVATKPLVPFDVDLGPGEDGQLVAVYTRCAREVEQLGEHLPFDPAAGRGCDLYRYDVATQRERRIPGASTAGADESWPTIWRGRIAFARAYAAKPQYPYIYVRPLAGGRSVRMPGGARAGCFRGRCADDDRSRPYALELYGKRLGFGWTYQGFGEGLTTEIRMDTIGGGHRRVMVQEGGGLTGRALGWPAFEAGRLFFTKACYGDTSGCVNQPELLRHRISTRDTDGADGPKAIVSHERSGRRSLVLVDTAPGTACTGDPAVPGGTCELQDLHPQFR